VTAAAPATLDDNELIGLTREAETRRNRPWTATLLIAAGFVVVAFAALAAPAHRPLRLDALATVVVCYVLASRVRFEFGTVLTIPTQPILVAMWFVLPPRLLPLVVFASLLIGFVPDALDKQVTRHRLAMLAVSSWFMVGPALVMFFLASGKPDWRHVPVYALALLAQWVFEFASIFPTTRAAIGISFGGHLRSVLPSYAVDALLAPLGILVGFATYPHPFALLLVLPVLLMFATFAKERQHRVDNALELSTAYRGTAMLLGDVIEADDEYTGSHSRHVVDLVLAVADRLGLDATARRRAEFAALLHDVGKVKVPPEIINKPGPLDDDEWELMKTHTILGEQMLDQIGGLLGEVGRIVRSCHERWDGEGYPDRLAGEAIPLEARIVCACDAWSAMRTDRSYRRALTQEAAIDELRACSGTHFDPRVVDALLAVV
jgi:HD-GYP domain-containing protein (c-di-GMP phosphodiesterase class II)